MATREAETLAYDGVPAFALRMVKGPMPARSWTIGDQPLVIGRGFGCSIRIPDPYVSRMQCEIVLREGMPWLKDLDSRNATMVNGAAMREGALKRGDVISFPSATLVVETATALKAFDSGSSASSNTTICFGDALHLRGTFDHAGYASSPRTVEQLYALFAMLRRLSACESVSELIESLKEHLAARLSPDACWVAWGEKPEGGLITHPAPPRGMIPPAAIMLEAFQSGDGVLSVEGAMVTIAAPLRHGGASFGALAVQRGMAAGSFDRDDLQYLLAAAESAAPLIRAVERHEQLRRDARELETGTPAVARMLGESAAMKTLRHSLAAAARAHGNVLLSGETGAGKELAARAIHELSARAAQPYIVVNCAAIPPELFEAEMFGHEAGAFTGAVRARDGMMQQAHGGTLFLDEVGDLSAQHQARLLRAVETGAFRTVGGRDEVLVDVRIVAATNRQLTGAGAVLRLDLYQRLSGMRIDLPPLRERGDDVLLLAENFRAVYGPQSLARPTTFSEEAKAALMRYPWPGNVRELRNVIQRACHTATWSEIGVDDLHINVPDELSDAEPAEAGTLDDVERAHIVKVLEQHEGNVHEAAKSLGIARSTLYYRMSRMGIRPPRRGE